MKAQSTPQKIAIFGGGIAGLSTAWQLTNQPNWQSMYEITIYQKGWRCGGKATTGLGSDGRIEERGIHMFQGWYENAFLMVQEVYAYIKQNNLNPNGAFQNWEDAYVKNPVTFMLEQDANNNWINWPFVFPNNNAVPGSGTPVSWQTLLTEALAMFLEVLIGSPYQEGMDGHVGIWNMWLRMEFFGDQAIKHESGMEKLWDEIKLEAKKIEVKAEFHILTKIVEKISALEKSEEREVLIKEIVSLSKTFLPWLLKSLEAKIAENNHVRRLIEIVELGIVTVVGVFTDVYNPNTHEFDWQNINPLDLRQWLANHNASPEVLNSAIVRFLYYGTFANLYNGNAGTIAADVSVRMMLMIPSYKGCFVWNMRGGTGGTFVAPLYMALAARGVNFEFFQELLNVEYSSTGTIQQIDMGTQVDLAVPNQPYNPIVQQNGVWQWLAQPDYTQLNSTQAQELIAGNIDLESSWSGWTNVGNYSLMNGVDFDIAVLATSIKPLATICSGIMANNTQWNNMVNNIAATPTLNVQFWLQPNDAGLGMDLGKWGMENNQYANTVIYENDLYSWTTMTFVEIFENWPANNTPQQISYWCGTWNAPYPLPPFSETGFPAQQLAALQADAMAWMNQYQGFFWPAAMLPNQGGFNYDLLCSSDPNMNPTQKFYDQWFAVNLDPCMHYVLAQPGTNQYRMQPGNTGFTNLFIAGDWTDFGLNVGYMEGTVISAMKAAAAILTQFFEAKRTELKVILGPEDYDKEVGVVEVVKKGVEK